MVQQVNYASDVASPFQSALKGYEYGLKLNAAEQAQQMEMQRQQLLNQELTSLRGKENPTFSDYERIVMLSPKDRAEGILKAWEQRSKDAQQNELRFIGQTVSALKTDPQVGIQRLRERAVAAENSGDKTQAQVFETWAKTAELNPKEAINLINIGTAYLPGAKDVFEAIAKATPTEKQGYEILTPEQTKQLGLPSGATYQRNVDTKKVELLGGGGERFEILPPAQASALGLPKGTYQRDATSGKISAVGSGGVTVNMPPQVGSIPPDYRMVYDAQNRPISMEVIPGSKTALQLVEKEEKGAAAAESAIARSGIVLEEIKGLSGAIKGQKIADPVTGTLGAVVGEKGGVFKAGSARATAEERIKTIKANIGFSELNKMRAESPTGGALGNITEQELAFLQSVLGSVDLSQKDSAILANLKRLEKVYGDIIKKAQAYPNADKYGFGKARAAPPAGDTVKVGNQTYSRPANFTDAQWNAYKQSVGSNQ